MTDLPQGHLKTCDFFKKFGLCDETVFFFGTATNSFCKLLSGQRVRLQEHTGISLDVGA